MTRRAAPAVCPDTVTNEVLLPPRGETQYWLMLGDEDVELLAQGICSEAVARQAFTMLSWKRDHYRKDAQDREAAGPVTPCGASGSIGRRRMVTR